MPYWNEPANRALLGRLLTALNARLKDDPPDDAFMVENINVAWSHIKDCLAEAINCGDESRCRTMIRQLADSDTPFLLFAHQFGILRNLLVKEALETGDIALARQAITLFEMMEENFAATYLEVFLNRLGTRNHLRLGHIRSLSDKNILTYFESHLEWIARLVEAVARRQTGALPELDPNACQFGCWLNGDGGRLIRDRSHIAQIRQLHESMHNVVGEVGNLLEHERASGPIYALLKKAETFSLELGNEISLLNSVIIMSVYNKDPLTGFLNRRFLDRVLVNQLEIAKATEVPFSVIMFDLDHFKRLNDEHGHQTGDRALEHIAAIVRDTLRQSDLIFRFGGEEFLLIAPSTALLPARALAERLRERIAATPLPSAPQVSLSASFGVIEVSPDSYQVVDARQVHDVIADCDAHLYAAKHAGRNRVV
ncbi:MAG: sensor domain-containing diguanylate cyclase [Azonexaceae bacterium]|nr:sensor domain-containing diguanylate cyclase [Azonexaceae bacterium]